MCESAARHGSYNYWSSSEFSETNGWKQNWNSSNPGNQNNNNKTNSYYVRAVRREKAMSGQCDMTVSELFQAYFDCRKSKRNTGNALAFEQNLERNLMDLYYELRSGEYRPGKSICFAVEYPKIREIWAADFRDRIVHHLLYNRVSERFYRRFIHDSYACIPGKGALAAVDRLEHMVRSASDGYRKPTFFLKADVANFFVSIKKPILHRLLQRRITEPWWMQLCAIILHHDPTQSVRVKGPYSILRKVPPHKSLFNAGGSGLPIGNLSSQFFANVYLDPIDQYAKHALKARRYVRYVDDIVMIGPDGGELRRKADLLDDFMQKNLDLHLHQNKTEVNRVERGINYLGYISRPYARYVRRSTIKQAHAKVCEVGPDRDKAIATANSYFGIMRHASAWRERRRLSLTLSEAGIRTDNALTKAIREV